MNPIKTLLSITWDIPIVWIVGVLAGGGVILYQLGTHEVWEKLTDKPTKIERIKELERQITDLNVKQNLAQVGDWKRATPAKSCRDVCDKYDLVALQTGQEGNKGYPFYVCRAPNAEGRPGFNNDVNEKTKDKCTVESGGQASYESIYDCVCLTKGL